MRVLTKLERRLEALEQGFRNVVGTVEDEQDKLSETSRPDDKEDKRELDREELNSSELSGTDLLKVHVEFNKEILDSDGDLVWVKDTDMRIVPPEKVPPEKQWLRYDVDRSGHLTFAVDRSTKLSEILLGFSPPESGQYSVSDDCLEFHSVFPLVHCRDRLKELEDSATDDRLRTELRILNLLYEHKHHFRKAKQQYDKLKEDRTISWETLRALFLIDQLVVFRELRDQWAIALMKRVVANDDAEVSEYDLELHYEAIDFDGKTFRTHMYRKRIGQFAGTKKVTELAVYPLSYHPDKEILIEDSIKSGSIWKTLHDESTTSDGQPGSTVMQYVGYCEIFQTRNSGLPQHMMANAESIGNEVRVYIYYCFIY